MWLPQQSSDGQVVLKTKEMPFCVAGMGDLLALFRCISCRFSFQTDDSQPERLGAPGRVFLSGCPEMACNVQDYPPGAYLRVAEAAQCRVQAHMLLPVFTCSPEDIEKKTKISKAIGVIEIVQASDDMSFLPMAQLIRTVFSQTSGLYTSPENDVVEQLPTERTMVKLPLESGVLHGKCSSSDMEDQWEEDQKGTNSKDSKDSKDSIKALNTKAGASLTFEDLQSHFGVGLKEAAAALGICVTTLKRACRRHGIQRWPRRALAKVSKALEEVNGKGLPLSAVPHPLPGPSMLGMFPTMVPPSAANGHDARWMALANMIPFNAQLTQPLYANAPPSSCAWPQDANQTYVNQPLAMETTIPFSNPWPNPSLYYQYADTQARNETNVDLSKDKSNQVGLFDPSMLEFMQFDRPDILNVNGRLSL